MVTRNEWVNRLWQLETSVEKAQDSTHELTYHCNRKRIAQKKIPAESRRRIARIKISRQKENPKEESIKTKPDSLPQRIEPTEERNHRAMTARGTSTRAMLELASNLNEGSDGPKSTERGIQSNLDKENEWTEGDTQQNTNRERESKLVVKRYCSHYSSW